MLFLGSVALLWVGVRVAVETVGIEAGSGDKRVATAPTVHGGERTLPVNDDGAIALVRTALPVTVWRPVAGLAPVWRVGPAPTGKLDPDAPPPLITEPLVRPELPADTPARVAPAFMSPVTIAPPARLPSTLSPAVDRWTLSAWGFVRPMSAPTPLGQGLLGGSQAGARGAWRIDRRGQAEVYARLVSSGRLGDGAEGALGVSLQPLRAVPVRLSVERREQIVGSGGRSAMATFASGGVSEVRLPLRMRLDGYAAAGVVGLRRRDLFAEGSVTVRRPVVRIGPVDLDAGVGAWGAVQPDLERIDVGPGISARWRLGGVSPRLSIDWRQRVVGDAAPQSGVAVTLAADF